MSQSQVSHPIIRLNRMGNIANYMIQVMVAHAIQSHAPDAVISGEGLPEWNLAFHASDDPSLPTVEVHKQQMDTSALGSLLTTGEAGRVSIMSYGQHMMNFLPRDHYRQLFDGSHIDVEGYSSDYLVINIRAGEILDARHPFYTLLPISFYESVIEQTGLIPVFMGQLGDDPYTMQLRTQFPQAVFEPSRGALADFEVIRRSKNIIPSVSTFSWLASWLSDADQIHFPVTGLLNPMHTGDVDLLPIGDPRYRLYLFPINYAIEVGRLAEAHQPLTAMWREITHAMYTTMREARPRFTPTPGDWLHIFSEEFYLKCYPDIRTAVDEGWFPSGREHYAAIGMAEGRASFYFEGGWYSRNYPMAAFEVAQGDFQDLRHHYASIGRKRGYRPVPATG